MSKKRVFPFGYQMRDGQVVVNPQEAELVREIFEQYRQGKTTPELAASAMLQGVPYREGAAVWNKNIVCRILDDSRYTGTDEYPPIVGQELYQAVRIRRAAGIKKEAVLPKAVREKMACPPVRADTVPHCQQARRNNLELSGLRVGKRMAGGQPAAPADYRHLKPADCRASPCRICRKGRCTFC